MFNYYNSFICAEGETGSPKKILLSTVQRYGGFFTPEIPTLWYFLHIPYLWYCGKMERGVLLQRVNDNNDEQNCIFTCKCGACNRLCE
jgi:hypothetical protein